MGGRIVAGDSGCQFHGLACRACHHRGQSLMMDAGAIVGNGGLSGAMACRYGHRQAHGIRLTAPYGLESHCRRHGAGHGCGHAPESAYNALPRMPVLTYLWLARMRPQARHAPRMTTAGGSTGAPLLHARPLPLLYRFGMAGFGKSGNPALYRAILAWLVEILPYGAAILGSKWKSAQMRTIRIRQNRFTYDRKSPLNFWTFRRRIILDSPNTNL